MNRLSLFFKVLLFTLTLLFYSCSENKFSCDEDVNLWTEQHIKAYLDADRKKIVELPLSRQMAIYNGLSKEKRYELWVGKFNYLLEDSTIDSNERDLYIKAIEVITPETFADNAALTPEATLLMDKAIRVLGDNSEKYLRSFCTWMTWKEYNQAIITDEPIRTKIEGDILDPDQKNCTCRHDLGCISTLSPCIKNETCKKKEKGCGFMGNYECDGICD